MKSGLKSKLSAATAALMGYEVGVGRRGPVDFSIIDKADRYLNGSSFNLPFNGPSIGTIAPGDVPKEPRLRVGVILAPGSAIRFVSDVFELHMRGRGEPLRTSAEVLDGSFRPAEKAIRDAFANGGLLENSHPEEELLYSLRVFDVAALPSQFVLRCPDVEFGGVRFRVKDFAFKYFAERSAVGLCA